jgi:hypothetical protein
MARCTPFKVPLTRTQFTHNYVDVDMALKARPDNTVTDVTPGGLVHTSKVDPASPGNAVWPENWSRTDSEHCKVVRRADLWWFYLLFDGGHDNRIWYGSSDGVTDLPLEIVPGVQYKVSFKIVTLAAGFDGVITCYVWFYQSDFSGSSTPYHSVWYKSGEWDFSGTKSGLFTAPNDAAWAQIRFNCHSGGDGGVRFRAVQMGVWY